MFEKYFNRDYEMIDFPHFVSKDDVDYNSEYARMVVDEKWVYYRWREDVDRGGWKRYEREAELISAHGGLNLEICAGPGGGFVPATLMMNYNANIMISDLCPAVVSEWKKRFQKWRTRLRI